MSIITQAEGSGTVGPELEPSILTASLNPPRASGVHPLAALLPLLDDNSPEFAALVASIREHGLIEPIMLLDGEILDGRNRWRACLKAGVQPRFVEYGDANDMPPLNYVLACNVHRRHLTEGQRTMIALDLVTTKHGGDRRSEKIKSAIADLSGDPDISRADAAYMMGVSIAALDRATFVRSRAVPEVIAKVKAGRMTLYRAAMLSKETLQEQRAAPDVKYGKRKPKAPPKETAALAKAWLETSEAGRREFADTVMTPWLRDNFTADGANKSQVGSNKSLLEF
jgi:ParB-like chromosome segregation protein Spo0J